MQCPHCTCPRPRRSWLAPILKTVWQYGHCVYISPDISRRRPKRIEILFHNNALASDYGNAARLRFVPDRLRKPLIMSKHLCAKSDFAQNKTHRARGSRSYLSEAQRRAGRNMPRPEGLSPDDPITVLRAWPIATAIVGSSRLVLESSGHNANVLGHNQRFLGPNLALHLGRSASSDSYGYDFSAERPTCFALFTLNPDPFMNYPG